MNNEKDTAMHRASKKEAYLEAQRKVESLRSFYKHLAIYITINLLVSGRIIWESMEDGLSFKQALSEGNTYTLWIIWGFFLLIQAINVFSSVSIFGSRWERRKIKQYMEEETRMQNS
ncbi:2TM domain-containing protein [Kordia sp.]|uniref:2TM domain-containing protein n=1 Tax=Kordia sp. TaxID=1965332 RepID=UPI003D6AC8C8